MAQKPDKKGKLPASFCPKCGNDSMPCHDCAAEALGDAAPDALDWDLPDEIVEKINAGLLSRLPNGGKPVIFVHGSPRPHPGFAEDEDDADGA